MPRSVPHYLPKDAQCPLLVPHYPQKNAPYSVPMRNAPYLFLTLALASVQSHVDETGRNILFWIHLTCNVICLNIVFLRNVIHSCASVLFKLSCSKLLLNFLQ